MTTENKNLSAMEEIRPTLAVIRLEGHANRNIFILEQQIGKSQLKFLFLAGFSGVFNLIPKYCSNLWKVCLPQASESAERDSGFCYVKFL